MVDHAVDVRTHVDDGWLEIESLVEDIARLSRSDASEREYYAQFTDRIVRATGAVAGAVWMIDEDGSLRCLYELNLSNSARLDAKHRKPEHVELLRDVTLHRRMPLVVPPRELADGQERSNPTDCWMLAGAISVGDEPVGAVEILVQSVVSDAARHGYLEFVSAVCEVASQFETDRQLRRLRERTAAWTDFERFVESVHGSLRQKSTAFAAANEGVHLVGCDRVTILLGRGRRCRTVAVSGVDRVERRSKTVRLLERLARAVVRGREPLWYDESAADVPPQVARPLEAYVDECHARMLAVVPLWDRPEEDGRRRVIGAVVAERFDQEQERTAFRERVSTLARHTEPAVRNAREYESLPLLGVERGLRWLGGAFGLSRLPKTMLVLLLLGGAVASLVLVPADFDIDADAELQPRVRRNVHAPSDGVLRLADDVHHGYDATEGEVLGRLRNLDLEFELRKVRGELRTAEKRRATVRATRLATSLTSAESRAKYRRLSAEEEELETVVEGLQRQLEALEDRQRELEVVAPLTGRVLSWNVERTLEGRPVERGQPLLTVADVQGPWVVEAHVPDHRIGHVLNASKESEDPLPVSFVLATEPDVTYEGTVQRIAHAAEFDDQGEATVLVTIAIDDVGAIRQLRPGATVVPRIHCGRRSLGYVWFHEVWEVIQMKLLF